MDVYSDLVWRGLIGDISNPAKIKDFFENKGGAYIGFDPSSSSFHLGNYQAICICRRLSEAGHKVYPLIGGMTGLIGDPRDPKLSTSAVLERQLKTKQEISENVDALTAQLKKYAHVQEVINNADFYQNMSVADYLRDIGKLINVNYLLEKDLIARRLETGISYAEFSYTLLQGYDSLYLYQNKNIICQFGGQDQWGNITTGLEMIRKVVGHDNKACCFGVPLFLKEDGTKFGKSEKGAIFLDAKLTPPFVMYQFFINQPDTQVESLLKRFTFLSKTEILKIVKEHLADPKLRIGQKAIVKEVLTDIHGVEVFNKCEKIANALFTNSLDKLLHDELYEALQGTNVIYINKTEINILDALLDSGLVKSKTEARRLVEQNAVSVNNKPIVDINFAIQKVTSYDNKFSYIKKSKKDYCLIEWK